MDFGDLSHSDLIASLEAAAEQRYEGDELLRVIDLIYLQPGPVELRNLAASLKLSPDWAISPI